MLLPSVIKCLSCCVSLCWMSLCWMSWRRYSILRCAWHKGWREWQRQSPQAMKRIIYINKACWDHFWWNTYLDHFEDKRPVTDKLLLTGWVLGRVFNTRSGCMQTIHLLPSVAIRPFLELKTRPKQLLGSLPLVNVLPGPVWYIFLLP